MADSRYYFVQDVMKMMEVKERKAYDIIRKFNNELEQQGKETIAGRIPKSYFHFRTEIDISTIARNTNVLRKVTQKKKAG